MRKQQLPTLLWVAALVSAALPAAAEPSAPVAVLPTESLAPPTRAAVTAQSVREPGDPRSVPRAPELATSPAPAPSGERRSTAAMVAGIVLVSASGLVMTYVGATAMADCGSDCESRASMTRGMVIGSVAAVVVGVPLIIFGAQRVPLESAVAPSLPRWAGGPGATGWGWRF
ncbi:MAG TPA: hypothetical protein VGY54_13175 [Polyangiaceae bacterium]|nr:hypothetical protein [Polyangiaceae bacterium]